MQLLVQVAREIAPPARWDDLSAVAAEVWAEAAPGSHLAEARFMRVIQDGIDFGKWPGGVTRTRTRARLARQPEPPGAA